MDVTICICSYGDGWRDKALELALRTASQFSDVGFSLVHSDEGPISEVRNLALESVNTEFAIFLDADDFLQSGYVKEMAKGIADVRVPSVRYVKNGVKGPPHVPHVVSCHHKAPCGPACLVRGNYVVIGAAARTEALRAVGGFRDWPMYEDWDLWLRLHLAGYSFENIPTAVYLATVNENSRNRAPSKAEKERTHKEILKSNGL